MSCRSVFPSLALRTGARPVLAAIGLSAFSLGVLGFGALGTTSANAQNLQVCSGYGAGFMRIPNSDSCMRVGGGVQAQGFAGGSLSNNANPGTGMSMGGSAETAPSSLASSSLSAAAQSASPLSSLSSPGAGGPGAPAVDPWKQAR